MIKHAVDAGRLHRVFPGVYAVGHPAIGSRGRMFAATLAGGEGSVVSHGTAAFLLGLWEKRPRQIDVIAPVEAGRRVAGIRRRHTPPPLPRDLWSEAGIPCTSPSRVIVDVAGITGEASLRRTIEQAAVHRMLNVREIDAILAGPRRRGSRQLRAILDGWRRYSPKVRVRSPMEAKLLPMLTHRDIPVPQCNAELRFGDAVIEVDFLWRRQRFVVETDGEKYHDNPQAKARDRRRDQILTATGYRVLRLTWADLEHRPEATMNKLIAQLNRAR